MLKKETVDYMTKENHLEGGKLLLDLMSEDDVFAEYFRGSGHSLWGYVVKDKSKAMHPLLTENFGVPIIDLFWKNCVSFRVGVVMQAQCSGWIGKGTIFSFF